ncbi:MOSC domain-containing protein [Roseomonas sp. AR75]|uniref:MOSC domain-containing protein n=1 Tax=Roseomonas sp. AR75 TaxID=2562311 RepID=UPI0014858278|nr:MOSC domain-containing protein [Roseomonas sp. AR75]
MRVEKIARYPVKGLSPEYMEAVELTEGQGLPHDRRFAFAQGDSAFDPAAPKWLPKRNFACLAVNAGIAAVHAAYDPHWDVLLLQAGESRLAADLRTAEGRQAAQAWLTAFMGEDARGALTLAEVPGHAFTDIPDKAVSIIGLASIADLGERAGMALDPLRFRANLLFSGGAAFEELDWVGRELLLGKARLRVFKRTQRCAATEVNPETAERDAKPPLWLRKQYGHADMGVYATVLEGGTVAVGDALEVVG